MRQLVFVLLTALTCAAAPALTVNEAIALSQAGVADEVIIAQMEADGTRLLLTPEEILLVREKGVSDAVVMALIKTGAPKPGLPPATFSTPVTAPRPSVVVVTPPSYWDRYPYYQAQPFGYFGSPYPYGAYSPGWYRPLPYNDRPTYRPPSSGGIHENGGKVNSNSHRDKDR